MMVYNILFKLDVFQWLLLFQKEFQLNNDPEHDAKKKQRRKDNYHGLKYSVTFICL